MIPIGVPGFDWKIKMKNSHFAPNRRSWLKVFTPYALLTVAPLCWAGNIVLARGVIDLIPPVSFAFWRWALAFSIILPIAWRPFAEQWRLAMRAWKTLLLLSLLGISGFNTLLYTAVHTTTAINGALIQTAMPAVIILISLLFYRQKSSVVQIVGVLLSITGAGMIVLHGHLADLMSLDLATGDLLICVAVILYALYSVLLRERPAIHPLAFLAVTFGMGTLGLVPFFVWEGLTVGLPALNLKVVGSIIYVAVFPSIVAYFCWNRGIELIGPNQAGLFINLVPLFASVLAILFLGESIQWFHFLGAALIFGGMLLVHTHG